MSSLRTQALKATMPAGTRVELITMNVREEERHYAIPSGTCGTVTLVDDVGTIHVNWDNGVTLGLIEGVDSWTIISNTARQSMMHVSSR